MSGTGFRDGSGLSGFAVLFMLIALLIRIFWRGDRGKREALEATCVWVGTRLEGSVLAAKWPRPPAIRFSAGGRSALLELVEAGGPEGMTRVTVDLRGCSPGSLTICREGLASAFWKRLGMGDLEIGDPDFDRRYLLRANPASVARSIFDPARRSQVVALVRSLDPFPDPAIDLTRESLTVRVGRYLSKDADFLLLARTARALAEYVLALQPQVGVFWLESAAAPGQCLVCGSLLEKAVVRCARCKTPHHRDCWTYNGRCATYACGGEICV
jgi:hypothetical protein